MTRAIRLNTKRITTPTPAAAKAWAGHFGCSVAELRIAMRAVGASAERVQAYLEALHGGRPPETRAVTPGREFAAPGFDPGACGPSARG